MPADKPGEDSSSSPTNSKISIKKFKKKISWSKLLHEVSMCIKMYTGQKSAFSHTDCVTGIDASSFPCGQKVLF